MKELAKLVIVLTVICAASGSLMALVHDMTAERIEIANQAGKIDAIREVLPECDNNPVEDTKTVETGGEEWMFYVARKGGVFAGTAFVATSEEGYGGNINVMVGIDAEGKVLAIEILPPLKETPGLGAKVVEDSFRQGFKGRDIRNTAWKVGKDGGDIDEITAATISSRAVVSAVGKGIAVYLDNKDRISR